MQVSSPRGYTGRVINLDVDTVRYPDGSTGELEMIRHPGAAAVIPFASDPAGPDPTILLLRQYRYATGEGDYGRDRKSTRLNSSHDQISYAGFCLKKKTQKTRTRSNVA